MIDSQAYAVLEPTTRRLKSKSQVQTTNPNPNMPIVLEIGQHYYAVESFVRLKVIQSLVLLSTREEGTECRTAPCEQKLARGNRYSTTAGNAHVRPFRVLHVSVDLGLLPLPALPSPCVSVLHVKFVNSWSPDNPQFPVFTALALRNFPSQFHTGDGSGSAHGRPGENESNVLCPVIPPPNPSIWPSMLFPGPCNRSDGNSTGAVTTSFFVTSPQSSPIAVNPATPSVRPAAGFQTSKNHTARRRDHIIRGSVIPRRYGEIVKNPEPMTGRRSKPASDPEDRPACTDTTCFREPGWPGVKGISSRAASESLTLRQATWPTTFLHIWKVMRW
jgi:hypothetical protein